MKPFISGCVLWLSLGFLWAPLLQAQVNEQGLKNLSERQTFLPLDNYVMRAIQSEDGKYLIVRVGDYKAGDYVCIDLVAGQVISRIKHKYSQNCAVGGETLCFFADNAIQVYDITTGKLVRTLKSPNEARLHAIVIGDKNKREMFASQGFFHLVKFSGGKPAIFKHRDIKGGYSTNHNETLFPDCDPMLKEMVYYFRGLRHLERRGMNLVEHHGRHIESVKGARPYLADKAILYGQYSLDKKTLKVKRGFSVTDNGHYEPILKPIYGSKNYAGYVHEKGIYVFKPTGEMIGKWSLVPEGKEGDYGPWHMTERFGISQKWGAGYVLPRKAKGVVLVAYGEDKAAGKDKPKPVAEKTGDERTSNEIRLSVTKGQPFSHKIELGPGWPDPTFSAIAKPYSMKLSAQGELTWAIPKFLSKAVRVKVKVVSGGNSKDVVLVLTP